MFEHGCDGEKRDEPGSFDPCGVHGRRRNPSLGPVREEIKDTAVRRLLSGLISLSGLSGV